MRPLELTVVAGYAFAHVYRRLANASCLPLGTKPIEFPCGRRDHSRRSSTRDREHFSAGAAYAATTAPRARGRTRDDPEARVARSSMRACSRRFWMSHQPLVAIPSHPSNLHGELVPCCRLSTSVRELFGARAINGDDGAVKLADALEKISTLKLLDLPCVHAMSQPQGYRRACEGLKTFSYIASSRATTRIPARRDSRMSGSFKTLLVLPCTSREIPTLYQQQVIWVGLIACLVPSPILAEHGRPHSPLAGQLHAAVSELLSPTALGGSKPMDMWPNGLDLDYGSVLLEVVCHVAVFISFAGRSRPRAIANFHSTLILGDNTGPDSTPELSTLLCTIPKPCNLITDTLINNAQVQPPSRCTT